MIAVIITIAADVFEKAHALAPSHVGRILGTFSSPRAGAGVCALPATVAPCCFH
jgi:hypothetical protein